jgi:arginine N-succinyltransferase
MLLIRAITLDDLDPLIEMAHQVGSGMTTLKPDREDAGRPRGDRGRLVRPDHPAGRARLHVRDGGHRSGRLAGVCAIKGAVGLTEPFYNYRIGTLVHSSRELDVFTRMDTLYLSNDLTGSDRTVLAVPASRIPHRHNGKWLSKSRFLFIAQFPHLFTEKLIAEMRGYQEETAPRRSTKGLGRHFFKMDFDHVDGLTASARSPSSPN